jgi:hypothetical protein
MDLEEIVAQEEMVQEKIQEEMKMNLNLHLFKMKLLLVNKLVLNLKESLVKNSNSNALLDV